MDQAKAKVQEDASMGWNFKLNNGSTIFRVEYKRKKRKKERRYLEIQVDTARYMGFRFIPFSCTCSPSLRSLARVLSCVPHI